MARVPAVLLVDQDPQARFELKQLVKQAQLTLAGAAALGTEAVSLAAETAPDVIVCGIGVPQERALQTIGALLDTRPDTPIVAYGWHSDLETMRAAMLAGARDFLVMPVEAERLNESILAVLESEEHKRLRQTGEAAKLGPRGLVISLFGAKGGVGKTTVATNVGVALSALMGQSAVLIDADTGFGDVAAMLDLKPRQTIIDLLRDIDNVDRDTVADYLTCHASGLWVLPAPRGTLQWRSVAPEGLRKIIDLLARRFDLVLVDSAGALSDISLAVLEEANMVLWITSPDFSSIHNSLLGLETLRELSYPEGRIRLILNATTPQNGIRPVKIEEALVRPLFWMVPYDQRLRLGTQIGWPLVLSSATSPGARSILQLAHAIAGTEPKPMLKPSTAPWRWLLNRRLPSNRPTTAVEGRS